jgi:glycine/D-amino acid oxidase-like deaminating enzyme/nitrite reductase/ring-hydroxylating ferredoxin subunit
MEFDPDRSSLWIDATRNVAYPVLERDVTVDVAVVGAGIAGVTTAYLLKKAGKSVALLEKGHAALRETGHTTAHLTHVVDRRLSDLVKTWGEDGAKAVWDANEVALHQIERLVREEAINCDFRRVSGFLFGPRPEDVDLLQEEARLASQFGYRPAFVAPADFPFRARSVVRFEGQARFQPRRYVLHLLEKVPGGGGDVFENTAVKEIDPGTPHRVVTEKGPVVTCSQVVVTAHVPFRNRVGVHAKQGAYRSYVIAARVPRGLVPDGLYWDTLDPYHYVRLQPMGDHDVVILGGEDHKTGQLTDTNVPYHKLIDWLRDQVGPEATLVGHWSGQIMEPVDGLPYVGPNVGGAKGEFIATGFSGNGMTYGTLAGMMLSDQVLGRETPWDRLFSPARFKLGGLGDFVRENADVAYRMVKDRVLGAQTTDLGSVKPGEGKIVRVGGKKVAVSRADDGELVGVSSVCTHVGCQVHWNTTERTWDCPCHGSRFLPGGEVLNGPATKGLGRVELGQEVGK